MNIHRFDQVTGIYVELIAGQSRFGYGLSGIEELYEVKEWVENGNYQGNKLLFYDFHTGKVYQPFEQKRNVVYQKLLFYDDTFYFLQGDFERNQLSIIRYYPETELHIHYQTSLNQVILYNLQLMGEPVYLVHQDDRLVSYFPIRFNCPLLYNEAALFIQDEMIYISAWFEEKIENDSAIDTYKYYSKLIIKDFEGNILSSETGDLTHSPDGSWWLS